MRILIPTTNQQSDFNTTYEGSEIVDYPAIASANQYIPIHSLISGLKRTENNKVDYFYNLIVNLDYIREVKQFGKFFEKLDEPGSYWYKLKHSTVTKTYFLRYGLLIYLNEFNKPVPLLTLAVKRDYLFEIDRRTPDVNQFAIIVDRQMIKDPEHYKLYRNLKPTYLDKFADDIDIVHTNSLVNLCYNMGVSTPKFRTIPEMISYYRSFNEIVKQELNNSR